jgi:tetratricopeptide (TPR) repeat protein
MPEPTAPDLSRLPLFASLSPEALQRLQACLVFQQAPAEQELVRLGDRCGLFGIVQSGLVCLEGPDGQLRTIGPDETFGEAMLRYGVPSAFAAHTLTPTTLWTLTHADWKSLQNTAYPRQAKPINPPPIARPEQVTPAPPPSVAKQPSARSPRHQRLGIFGFLFVALLLVATIIGSLLVASGGSWLALMLLDAHRPDEAASVLRLALAIQPNSAPLTDTYGYLLFRQGEMLPAQIQFERALYLDPELASALNNLGVTLLARGEYSQAIDQLQTASTLDPGNTGLIQNLADAYLGSGDLESAMAAYQNAFTIDPSLETARSRWAILALDHGELEDARQAWLQVITATPLDAEAQLGLGVIAWREGRPAAALQHLQSARQSDPGNPLTRLYLGLAWQAIDRPDKAVPEFEQALALSQDLAVQNLSREHLLELYASSDNLELPQGVGVKGGEQQTAP